MVASEDSSARRGGISEGKVNGAGLHDSDADSHFTHTRAELTNLFDSLKRIAFVEWQVMRLRAIDTFFRGIFFFSIASFTIAASIAAALLLVKGVRGAVEATGAAAWIGDLGGAAIVLALVAIVAIALRATLRHNRFRELEQRLTSRTQPSDGAPS